MNLHKRDDARTHGVTIIPEDSFFALTEKLKLTTGVRGEGPLLHHSRRCSGLFHPERSQASESTVVFSLRRPARFFLDKTNLFRVKVSALGCNALHVSGAIGVRKMNKIHDRQNL